jgi:hypothetical protein
MKRTTKEMILLLSEMQMQLWNDMRMIRDSDHKNEAVADLIHLQQAWSRIDAANKALQEYEAIKAPWQS